MRAGRFVAVWAILASIPALLPASPSSAADVDTEHMFGFTEGSDIGTARQPEAELETIGAFGRADGSYSAVSATASLKYPLTNAFRLAPSITFTRFDSSGVTDIEDLQQVKAERVGLEFRWRALARETAPVGLTFVAAPALGFVDPVSGAPADAWGMGLIGIVDRALIPERLFAALNLVYDFGRVRNHASGLTTDTSFLGFDAAFSTRLLPWFYAGAEVRYERAFDGLALGTLVGQAVNMGPVFYMTMGQGVSLSGGWNIQAWGTATAKAAGLDLVNFNRNLFKLRLAIDL